tara:strand:+ start:561 stop:1571 length:1011 start_codon:yes stop_codon:yes gene_type:complete
VTIRKRVAVTLPAGPNLDNTAKLVKWAEDNGYDDAWFGDSGAPDSLTSAAAIAHHVDRLRVGVAATPVYTRSPSVFAATANVLAQILPQRFVVGLGSSSQTMMGRWNGIPLEMPLTRVAETAKLVRSMLAGEKTDFDGRTVQSHGYRQPKVEHPPPIYIAALRPKMIEMAAAVGDGLIFNLWPKRALPLMMKHVQIGSDNSGKDRANIEIVNRAHVLCTDNKEEARDLFRMNFAPYYATPVYNKFLAWSGYVSEAEAIAEGWAEKDRNKTTGALTDDLIDQIAVIGDEHEIRDRILEDFAGGIDTTIIAPFLGAPQELVNRTFAAFSSSNFSLPGN